MRNKMAPWIAGGLSALAIAGGAACSSNSKSPASVASNGHQSTATSSSPTPQPQQPAVSVSGSNANQATGPVSAVVKAAQPAVVRIETSGGVGTGFFVSSDGYIVTNDHVIQITSRRATTTASNIQVTMDDGTVKTASVVGEDSKSDLTLLKVDGSGFSYLKFASLENTNVGDEVVAIGYALDLSNGQGAPTVTSGIVSAKNRAISETDTTAVLGSIQTDAAINHGNSGGPLLNMNGEVVGINTSLVPDQETGTAAIGISLAVGADTANAVFGQLKASGKVDRGYLGIQYFRPVRPAQAKQLGMPNGTGGVYLPTGNELNQEGLTGTGASSVAPNGPAAQGGIQPGDVITAIAGQPVSDESQLAVALINHHAGEKVSVQIFRGGKSQTLDVTLGSSPG